MGRQSILRLSHTQITPTHTTMCKQSVCQNEGCGKRTWWGCGQHRLCHEPDPRERAVQVCQPQRCQPNVGLRPVDVWRRCEDQVEPAELLVSPPVRASVTRWPAVERGKNRDGRRKL